MNNVLLNLTLLKSNSFFVEKFSSCKLIKKNLPTFSWQTLQYQQKWINSSFLNWKKKDFCFVFPVEMTFLWYLKALLNSRIPIIRRCHSTPTCNPNTWLISLFNEIVLFFNTSKMPGILIFLYQPSDLKLSMSVKKYDNTCNLVFHSYFNV